MELGKNVRDLIDISISVSVHVSVRNPVFVSLWDSFNRSFWNLKHLK